MHRLPAILMLGFCLPLCLFAADWTPYVGVGGSSSFTFTHYGVGASPDRWEMGEPFSGFGSQYEAGLAGPEADIYLSYERSAPYDLKGDGSSYSNSNMTRISDYWYRWSDERWAVGGRFKLIHEPAARVQPVLGVALTAGHTNADRFSRTSIYHYDSTYSYERTSGRIHKRSDIGVGLRAEFGFLIHMPASVDLQILSQLHYFGSEDPLSLAEESCFPTDGVMAIQPALFVSLRYVFRSLRFGN